MRVSYRIVGATPATWVKLFDQADGATVVMPEFKGSVQFINQTVPGFGAASEAEIPEGNACVSLPWKFGQSYEASGGGTPSQQAAASIRAMQALGGLKLHLQVIIDGETQYYPNGVVESYDFEQNNAYMWHSFQFKTELMTATPPTT